MESHALCRRRNLRAAHPPLELVEAVDKLRVVTRRPNVEPMAETMNNDTPRSIEVKKRGALDYVTERQIRRSQVGVLKLKTEPGNKQAVTGRGMIKADVFHGLTS